MNASLTLPDKPTIVVKIGSSSIVNDAGHLDRARVGHVCEQLCAGRDRGARVVLVSSGAIAAGLGELGLSDRPGDMESLQALASVGQVRLMDAYLAALGSRGVKAGQVLLTRHAFEHRAQYLNARSTLRRLIDMDILPIVNENDTVATDELRFGENDRLSALVAHLVAADLLVLLTDQPGLFSADPRFVADATLIEEVTTIDAEIERAVSDGSSGPFGSGGMASKLAAAKMARWSAITTLIADSATEGLIGSILDGQATGTVVRPHGRRLSSRKLWIAFAQGVAGTVTIDEGAVRALRADGGSLLAVGVIASAGDFRTGDAVEILDPDSGFVAKGIARIDRSEVETVRGRRDAPVVVHRDDMVVPA